MKIEINSVVDLGIIFTIISVLVIYFGKLIIKIKKMKKTTILEEGVIGFSFLGLYVLLPLLIIYFLVNANFFLNNWKSQIFWVCLIIVQFVIFLLYQNRNKSEKVKIKWGFIILGVLFASISLGITYYFLNSNNPLFFTISLLFNIIILTFIAIKENKLK
jgi:heme A synthase